MDRLETRRLKDIEGVLFDRAWAKQANADFKVYEVRRAVKRKGCLRYDETVVFPRLLGREFPKTKGHEHPSECTELMKVVKGQAIFLLQKDEGKRVEDAYFVRAKRGQAVISPSGYSHVTINPTKKELKIGTWMADSCLSSYQTIKKLRGAGYYYTLSGWQKNKNYQKLPRLKEKKPLEAIPKKLTF